MAVRTTADAQNLSTEKETADSNNTKSHICPFTFAGRFSAIETKLR